LHDVYEVKNNRVVLTIFSLVMKSPSNRSLGILRIEVRSTTGEVVSGYEGTHTSKVVQELYEKLLALLEASKAEAETEDECDSDATELIT